MEIMFLTSFLPNTRMLQESLDLSYDEARQRLLEAGSVNKCL